MYALLVMQNLAQRKHQQLTSSSHLLGRGVQNGGPRIVWSTRGTASESFPMTPLLPPTWLLSVSQLLEAEPHRAPQPADWAPAPRFFLRLGCRQPPSPCQGWSGACHSPSREVCLCATPTSACTAQRGLVKSRGSTGPKSRG